MKKVWYIVDDQGTIINEEGHEDITEAIAHFKNYMRTPEEAEGFTLCRMLEENGSWLECLEELTPGDIF